MKLTTTHLLSSILLVDLASAHTIFQKLYVNGVDQGESTGIRAPSYDGVRPYTFSFVFLVIIKADCTYSPSQTSRRTTSSATEVSGNTYYSFFTDLYSYS